jgi:hypothetical protein
VHRLARLIELHHLRVPRPLALPEERPERRLFAESIEDREAHDVLKLLLEVRRRRVLGDVQREDGRALGLLSGVYEVLQDTALELRSASVRSSSSTSTGASV